MGSEDLTGTDADDKIDGLGGEDIIDGSFGTDILYVFDNEQSITVHSLNGITRLSSSDEDSEYYIYPTKLMELKLLNFLMMRYRSTTQNWW